MRVCASMTRQRCYSTPIPERVGHTQFRNGMHVTYDSKDQYVVLLVLLLLLSLLLELFLLSNGCIYVVTALLGFLHREGLCEVLCSSVCCIVLKMFILLMLLFVLRRYVCTYCKITIYVVERLPFDNVYAGSREQGSHLNNGITK